MPAWEAAKAPASLRRQSDHTRSASCPLQERFVGPRNSRLVISRQRPQTLHLRLGLSQQTKTCTAHNCGIQRHESAMCLTFCCTSTLCELGYTDSQPRLTRIVLEHIFYKLGDGFEENVLNSRATHPTPPYMPLIISKRSIRERFAGDESLLSAMAVSSGPWRSDETALHT